MFTVMLKKDLIDKATKIVLSEIPKYMTNKDKFAISKFTNGKLTLAELGICNGVSMFIDEKLQEIHPEICILESDTLPKFISDIKLYIDRIFTTPRREGNNNKNRFHKHK